MTFNPQIVSYATLLQVFFSSHDPSTVNRQGADIGSQYRSAIFYHNMNQGQIASNYIQQINQTRIYPIVTQLIPFSAFYPAENYHQFFEARHPGLYQTGGASYPQQIYQTTSYPQIYQTGSYPQLYQTGSYPQLVQSGSYPQLYQTGSYPQLVHSGSFPQLVQSASTGYFPTENYPQLYQSASQGIVIA